MDTGTLPGVNGGLTGPPFAAALSTFRRVALVDGAYFTTARPYSRGFCEYLSVNLHIYRIFIRSPSPEYISCNRQQGVSGHEKPPTGGFSHAVPRHAADVGLCSFQERIFPAASTSSSSGPSWLENSSGDSVRAYARCCPPPPGRPPPVPGR